MLHHLRAAWRSLARRRGLSAAVVLTLALGIGANSAIFSVIDAVLLKPLPYSQADRLVAVYEANAEQKQRTSLVAPGRLEEWNAQSQTLAGLAGSYFENMTDTTGAMPERVEAMRTSPRFFSVMGTPAALGRTPAPEEERLGGPRVVVVSHAFWRARLNADPAAVGRSLTLAGVPRAIIGVMPGSFRFPTATTQVWVPAQTPPSLLQARQARFYHAVARLKPGVSVTAAEQDLIAVQARLAEQYPETDRGWSATVASLKEEKIGGVRRSLWLLFGAVLLVLLAACANVACLLLADATRREQEVAVRFALGADRPTVVRQLLREGLVLSACGSAVGLLLARGVISFLRAFATQLPRVQELALDWRLVAFSFALSILTTLAFALAPALRATRRDVAERLARAGRGSSGGRHHVQRALVTAQVSLAIVLLVGAGLLVRSFARLQDVSPGFAADDVLTFRISAAWSEKPDAVALRQLRTLERLRGIPGVVSASMTTWLPAASDWPPAEWEIDGRMNTAAERPFGVARQVSADYFRTLQVPVLEGESCRDDPRPEAPKTLIVSHAFASRYFPAGSSALGHSLSSPEARRAQREARLIGGVVGDVREQSLMKDPAPAVYSCGLMPYWPDPFYLVRSDPARPASFSAIREAIREIEPGRAVYASALLKDTLAESIAQPRLYTMLLGAFAATALLLAFVGLYGMLAQFVSERRREIGVRMALGARPAQVLSSVVGHAAAVIGAGVAVGLALALGASRLMASLVFGISARDPLTFAVVPLLLATIAVGAAIVPARRAVRVDPVEALRAE
jgi:predicted permease